MSILDKNPLLQMKPEQMAEFKEIYEELLEKAVKEAGMEDNPAWQALKQGAAPAAGLGLEEEHLEAMYAQAFDLLQNGDTVRAHAIFLTLMQLDPYEPKYVYALGAACQLAGQYEKAAQVYVMFIPMDATNPEGFLRLGECLRACGEYENAHGCFEIAALEAERGNGRPEAAEYARAQMAELDGTF